VAEALEATVSQRLFKWPGRFFVVIFLPGFESLSQQTKRIAEEVLLGAEALDWWLRLSKPPKPGPFGCSLQKDTPKSTSFTLLADPERQARRLEMILESTV